MQAMNVKRQFSSEPADVVEKPVTANIVTNTGAGKNHGLQSLKEIQKHRHAREPYDVESNREEDQIKHLRLKVDQAMVNRMRMAEEAAVAEKAAGNAGR